MPLLITAQCTAQVAQYVKLVKVFHCMSFGECTGIVFQPGTGLSVYTLGPGTLQGSFVLLFGEWVAVLISMPSAIDRRRRGWWG